MFVVCIKHWLPLSDSTVKLNFIKTTAQSPSRNRNAADIDNILKRKVIVYFGNTEKKSIVIDTGLTPPLRSWLPSMERFKLIITQGTADDGLTAVDFFSDSAG